LVELHGGATATRCSRSPRSRAASVDDLRSWNGLKKNTIYAGQKLKVKKA
jgi:hypothetical protein